MQVPTGTSSSEASLMPLLMGHMASRVIFVAAQLNLADLIAEGCQTIAELADRTRTHAPSLERVLRTLGSLGVLDETEPGKLVLTPLGNQLRTGVSGSVRDLALMFGNERSWQSWGDLPHSVRTGESAAQRIYGMSGFE
jgi:orsellinic acid C2-O-methyltransferase